VRQWPLGFPHKYENPTEAEQVILCVDRPCFIPEDEIPVAVPDEDLREMVAENFYGPQILDS
jgi:dihydroneopterin aldolase